MQLYSITILFLISLFGCFLYEVNTPEFSRLFYKAENEDPKEHFYARSDWILTVEAHSVSHHTSVLISTARTTLMVETEGAATTST